MHDDPVDGTRTPGRAKIVIEPHHCIPTGNINGVATPVRVGRRTTVVRTEVRGDNDKLLAEVTTTHEPT